MFKRLIYSKNNAQAIPPPGPRGLPILGNLIEAWRDPLRFALQLAHDYGDISYYRIGRFTGYLINHPDHIRHVLQRHHRNYSKQNYHHEMLRPVLGEGLITSNGDHWLRERRLIQPAFQPRRIGRFASVTTEATAELLGGWETIASRDQPIDVAGEMMRLALHIVGKALFSTDVSGEAGTVDHAFSILNQHVSFRFRTVFVPPLWVPTPRNMAFKRARADLDRLVYRIIANRRRAGGPTDDLLGMLLAARDEESGARMTDQQVRDEVTTLLLAGHETTANLLTWTWYLLAQHPEPAALLRAELDAVLSGRTPSVDDLPSLEYTACLLHESMRLYPPVWILSRIAIDDDEIAGVQIPVGTTVAISPYTTHRHPGFWDNPNAFKPERFSREQVLKRHKYAYIPFGGGPRHCVGNNFAMMEAQLILATIGQRYKLDLAPGQPVRPEPLITLRPRHGLPMLLRPV